MKNLKLSYKELVQYLDFTSTDPMVRQLVAYINDREESIIEGLVEAGMDPIDCRFDYDGFYHSPGDFISKLRNDTEYAEREAAEWEEKYYRVKDERDQLRARSVAELLSEMSEQVKRAHADRNNSDRIAEKYKQENQELQEKINVWTILEKT
jgi:hypothetical protein